MSATNDLFTRWKALKRLQSDREAAAMLGVSHGAPHHWRQGRNGAAAVIERMAKDLGEDAVPVILQAFAEAAKDAEDKRTLSRLARRLGAACVAVLALAPLMMPSSAQAATGADSPDAVRVHLIHYAKWLTARLRAIPAWCRDFLEPSPCNPLALYPVRP